MPEPRNKVRELNVEHDRLLNEAQEMVEATEGSEAEFDQEKFDKLHERMATLRERAQEIEGRYKALEEAREFAEREDETALRERTQRGFDRGEAPVREDRVTKMAGREVRSRKDPEVRELNERYRDAFWRYMRDGLQGIDRGTVDTLRQGRYAAIDEERAVLQVGTSNLGGVLAPTEFQEEFFEEMKAFGGLRGIARVIQTPHGREIQFPSLADTGNQASLVSEASTIGSSPNAALGLITYRAHKYQSGPLRLSREFIQDSRMAAEPLARGLIAQRLGRKTSFDYLSSTGGGDRPTGLTQASTDIAVKSTAGSSVGLTFENLYELKHSIDPAWRNGARWLFSDESFKNISKLTDNDGQFLLQPRVTEAAPQMLLGHAVTIDNSSSDLNLDPGTLQRIIWFGDFSQFLIRDSLQLVVRRLDERFALTDEVGFVGFMRTDADMAVHSTTPDSLRPIRPLAIRATT